MSDITNEMKARCIGKFSFPVSDACPKCALSFPGADCACDGSGEYQKRVVVPWHTCKEIYKAMLACSPAEARLAALKEENERLKEILGRQCTLAATLADERDALNARMAELVTIGKEMASDLEDAICARYGANVARLHPALVNNFKRDLDVVHRFRQKVDMEEPCDEG